MEQSVLIELNPHATELIIYSPVQAYKMEFFGT